MGEIRTVNAPAARPLSVTFGARALNIGDGLLLAGIAALLVPTLLHLGRWSWSTEAGAHGPIVLATAAWLIWREAAALRAGVRQPLWPGIVGLIIGLPLYCIGRITSVLMLESLALYFVLLTLAYLRYGGAVLRRFWFPCVYLLFLITPPENWIFVATRPLKMAISNIAVEILATCGFAVGSSGPLIQIDGYQLLVASACSGLNSLIGIGAISLFYVYLRHGSQPRYAFILLLLLLPIALLTNLLRVVGLVLATHWFGPGVAEGLTHEVAGLGTFAVALALLLAIDAVLFPVMRRLGWANG